jgi:hypothetical protein
MEISISVTTTGSLLEGNTPGIIQKNLETFVAQASLLLWNETKKRTPQGVYGAQGGLMASIQHELQGVGTPIVKGLVVSAHSYAEVVEKGRTPGKAMPPKGSLLRWLQVKLGLSAETAQRVEYLVRRKIGIKGTKGAQMFQKAVEENTARLESMARGLGLQIATELNA